MADSTLVNRNITAGGKRTSMRLEPELWNGLHEICRRERVDLSTMVRRIHKESGGGGRTSAVRVYVLRYFRAATTEEGHRSVGHGAVPEHGGGHHPRVATM